MVGADDEVLGVEPAQGTATDIGVATVEPSSAPPQPSAEVFAAGPVASPDWPRTTVAIAMEATASANAEDQGARASSPPPEVLGHGTTPCPRTATMRLEVGEGLRTLLLDRDPGFLEDAKRRLYHT